MEDAKGMNSVMDKDGVLIGCAKELQDSPRTRNLFMMKISLAENVQLHQMKSATRTEITIALGFEDALIKDSAKIYHQKAQIIGTQKYKHTIDALSPMTPITQSDITFAMAQGHALI